MSRESHSTAQKSAWPKAIIVANLLPPKPIDRILLATRPAIHTVYGMKMTLHIDEHVLAEVMAAHGFETKTEAIAFALKELDRRSKLRAYREHGLGLSSAELKDAVYEDYTPHESMVAEPKMIFNADQKKK